MKTADKTMKALCAATGTRPREWREIDGPQSRHGIDRWFRHKRTGDEAYTNNDQGAYHRVPMVRRTIHILS